MIDRPLGSENALEKNHFIHPRLSKIVPSPAFKLASQQLRRPFKVAPATDGQMGSELPPLARKAEGLKRPLYCCRQRSELPLFQSDPEDSRPSYIRKYPHTSSKNSKAWEGADGLLQCLGDRFFFGLFDRSEELKGK